MAITKEKKQEIVEDLKKKIDKQKIMIFAGFTGLKNKDFTDLRKDLKSQDSDLMVAKKTLIKIAFKEKDIEINDEVLKGENAVIFGFQDQISPAKFAFGFSKSNPSFEIKGGLLEGQVKKSEDIISLAQLPPKEVVMGQLVGTISSPITGLLSAFNGNIRNLINTLKQIEN